ncbi:uncharacterized protein LOC114286694 isoform X1 [Camellia sinensis]|uniref:uncharacterized protein LOC114286694 isoform X1 n=1 Tax=Camellia sinensis TaxID=4442 RepID=UPI001035ED23|nr:uncharacterized protein LOC114286694 isoform X1 [Camellia sinensis]
MEFFTKVKAVKLRSHLDKYLAADDDKETVRQSRQGSARKARWLVEPVDGNPQLIRLKGIHGSYLAASAAPFLLGMTGNKVVQAKLDDSSETTTEWQPIRDGFQVKLKAAAGGTYLRANGGTPPWRNTVTHDIPLAGSTHNWVLWEAEAVEIPENEALNDYLSLVSSFSSLSDEVFGSEEVESPMSIRSYNSPKLSTKKTGMDLFRNAKAVRLRSHHDKYLLADDDEDSVTQDRNGSAKNARWTVEFVDDDSGGANFLRLKSCFEKYLTASNQPFLLGMTGHKVVQSSPAGRLDSSVEWEPIREGNQVKLKTRYGHFLRANGGVPPWRNSVTHDIPHRTATQDWILWEVHVVEIVIVHSPKPKDWILWEVHVVEIVIVHSPKPKAVVQAVPRLDEFASDSSSPSTHSAKSNSFGRQESIDSVGSSPPKAADGRAIYYSVADEFGNVNEGDEGHCITFKGNGVDELTRRLEDETGIEDIAVCSRSPLNGKLYPLRLQLPPNNVTMHVVVVPSSSKVARDFAKAGITL